MSSGAQITLPHRTVPVLNTNPAALRRGAPQDPTTAIMNEPWYLALQSLFNGGSAAGGDASGVLSSLTVIGLQGRPISVTAPTTGQILEWNGTAWIPASPSVTPGAAKIDYHTLSGAFNIVASVLPAPTNGLLRVFLTMASGAVQPTWDAASFSLAPGAISIVVGSRTVVCFCADGAGKWAMEAPPVTNR